MMTYATVATFTLLTSLALNDVVWTPSAMATVHGIVTAATSRSESYSPVMGSSSSSYDNGDDDGVDDGGGDGGNDGDNDEIGGEDGDYAGDGSLEQQTGEDQLDQDDPVSTVTVTAVRGSMAWLPCDIGGGDNDGLPAQPDKIVSTGEGKTKDTSNAMEDRAYMVLWFKHQRQPTIRHRNSKTKGKKMSSVGKPLYSFDVRGRHLAQALKWSSGEENGGFGPRASFVVFGSGSGGRDRWSNKSRLPLDHRGSDLYDNSTKAALRVVNITEQDAGAYRCRVDFRDSPTRNYRIILRVIAPADKITISYNGGPEIEGGAHHVIGPVAEGSQLVLVCKVHGGKPKPRVQWYSKYGKVAAFMHSGMANLVEEEYTGNDGDDEMTTKKLVIYQLNRSHANSTYTCLAENEDNTIESNLRMSVMINMYLNVKSVRIVDLHPMDESENTVTYNENGNNNGVSPQGTNLNSGKWYTGECWAEGATPQATIEWSVDGNGTLADEIPSSPTTAHITVVEQTEHSSRIRFKPTPSDDGRYLRCRAWNPDINTTKDNVKNKALLLNVQYPPIVKLSLGHTFDPSRIKTGDDVYFECQVLAGGGSRGKQRNRIEWYHNGHPILQNGSSTSSDGINSDIKVVLLSAGTLVIRNVSRRHSGQYTCQCSNDLGMGRSRPVTLRVQYAPVCADDDSQLQLVGVEKNEIDVHVLCRVKADPVDDQMQFEWLVWPGTAAAVAELHQEQLPSVVATGSYVTSALSSTPTGLVVGELVLPATTVGVPDVVQYADRTSGPKKPVILDTVSCRATNTVGRQQNPCLYYIIPASTPGPLTGCTIRLPEDQQRQFYIDDRHNHHHRNHHHHHRRRRQRRTPPVDNGSADKDTAIISCNLENDGGVRPVTYSMEIYESNVLTTAFFGSGEDTTVDLHRNKYRNEWLVDNITGAAVGNAIEYRVNRNNLQLRIGPNESRKYLCLAAFAGNRLGRGPQTYFGSENVVMLRHPWWWHGEYADESSTRPSGTSSTGKTREEVTSFRPNNFNEHKTDSVISTLDNWTNLIFHQWWIMLGGGGGGGDDRRRGNMPGNGGGDDDYGTASNTVAIVSTVATFVAAVVAFVLWRKRRGRRLAATTETTIGTNLIGGSGGGGVDDKCNSKMTPAAYSLLAQQQHQQFQQIQQQQQCLQRNVYPNLTASNGTGYDYNVGDYDDGGDVDGGGGHVTIAGPAPDIMSQQNDYGKRCLVSIANRGIPGPESCV